MKIDDYGWLLVFNKPDLRWSSLVKKPFPRPIYIEDFNKASSIYLVHNTTVVLSLLLHVRYASDDGILIIRNAKDFTEYRYDVPEATQNRDLLPEIQKWCSQILQANVEKLQVRWDNRSIELAEAKSTSDAWFNLFGMAK